MAMVLGFKTSSKNSVAVTFVALEATLAAVLIGFKLLRRNVSIVKVQGETVKITSRTTMSWKQAIAFGVIAAFFCVLLTAVLIYMGACSSTLSDAVGLSNRSDLDNLIGCTKAGVALSAAWWAGCMLSTLGAAYGWYFSSKVTSETLLQPNNGDGKGEASNC